MRFAFAAAIFGESSEALFWLQLPSALSHLMNKLANKSPQRGQSSTSNVDLDEASMLNRITSKGKSMPRTGKKEALVNLFFVWFFILRKSQVSLLDFLKSKYVLQIKNHLLFLLVSFEAYRSFI